MTNKNWPRYQLIQGAVPALWGPPALRVFPSLTNDGEDERVGEVLVQGQLHHIPAELQESGGLGQTDENVNLVKEDQNSTELAEHPNYIT